MEDIYERKVKVKPDSEAEGRLIELLQPVLDELKEQYQLNIGILNSELYHEYCFSENAYQIIREHLQEAQ